MQRQSLPGRASLGALTMALLASAVPTVTGQAPCESKALAGPGAKRPLEKSPKSQEKRAAPGCQAANFTRLVRNTALFK